MYYFLIYVLNNVYSLEILLKCQSALNLCNQYIPIFVVILPCLLFTCQTELNAEPFDQLELDESNLSQSYIAVEDGGNVSTNSIEEILNFSQRLAANQSIIEERLINEYDHDSDDDDPEIIAETDDEEQEGEDDEDDFRNRRAKMPRLHSNLDLKETAKEPEKKVEEEVPEEEVIYW